jgi:hypothetical protein
MSYMGTSPLERSILTHYWTTPSPWKNGSENWSDEDRRIVDKLIVLRLLRHEEGEHGHHHLVANDDAVRVYMDALAAVPYPILKWVMPRESET